MQSAASDTMHSELLAQVLGERNLSKAGDLFAIDDADIERDVERAAQILRNIVNAPDYVRSANDQSVVEICITRLTTAIRETKSIDRHAVALAVLLESCLGHDLSCAAKDRDPPHAKIVADILSCIFLSRAHWTVIERILPTAIWLLTKGNRELCRNLTSYLCLAAADHAPLLSSYLPLILNSILVHRNHLLIRILPHIYDENSGPIHLNLRDLLSRLPDCELSEKNAILHLCRLVASRNPQILRPCISQLSLHLVSTATSSAVLAIYADIATTMPEVLVRHIPRIRQTAVTQPLCTGAVAAILGCVARKCQSQTKDCVSSLVSMFSATSDVHAHLALLCELRSTAEVRPDQVSLFVSDVGRLAADSSSASVRLLAQQLTEALTTSHRVKTGIDAAPDTTLERTHLRIPAPPTDIAMCDSQTAICSGDSDVAIDCSGSLGSHLSYAPGARSHIDLYISDLGSAWKHPDDLQSRRPGLDSTYRRSDDSVGSIVRYRGNPAAGDFRRNTDLSYSYQRLFDSTANRNPRRDDRFHDDVFDGKRGSLISADSGRYPPDGLYNSRSPTYFFPSLGRGRDATGLSGMMACVPYSPIGKEGPSGTINAYGPPSSENVRNYVEPTERGKDCDDIRQSHDPYGTSELQACAAPDNFYRQTSTRPVSSTSTPNSAGNCSVALEAPAAAAAPMRDAVQQFCEKHLTKIHSYVREASARLPLPVAMRLQDNGEKPTCVVEFSCDECGQFCLYDRQRFAFRTKNARTWIHLLFLAVQAHLTEPVSQSDPTVSSLKSLWDSLSFNTNGSSFIQVITSSFPSQKAEMAVRRELANAQYFSTFERRPSSTEPSTSLSPATQWACFLCHRPELAASLIQMDGLPCLEGQLEKKRGRFQALQPWKLRHFKLTGTTITYNKNGVQLRTVSSIHEVRVLPSRRGVGFGAGTNGGCTFKIYTTSGETLSLRSRNIGDAERWLLCLRVVIARSHCAVPYIESINMGIV